MGIKDMLRREDFYRILRETILNYARIVLGKEVRCEYNPFDGCEPWIVNRVLGFVSRVPVPHGLRVYMRSEYNVRGSFVKNLIGKVAVNIITRFPRIGASRIIYVSPGVFDKSVFIVPQNRSVRFYDYKKMTVDCIVKSGFTNRYFDTQASFRTNFQYDFLNPLLMQGNGWFQESVLHGHPLVRTTDPILFKKGIEDAFSYIKTLATDTLEWIPVTEYIEKLKVDALLKIERAQRVKCIIESESAIKLVEQAVTLALRNNNDIPTCISHGDFQSGNIWMEHSGRTIIYDWETAGRRSVWYDSATLYYSLRRAFGWSNMIKDESAIGLKRCLPDDVTINRDRISIMGIVLLEDILFYLDDMLELPNQWGNEDFDRFIRIIKDLNLEV